MNYRYDLLNWRRAKLDNPPYEDLAERSGISSTTLCDAFRGVIDPRASTLKAIFEAMDLDPKYAMDFRLKENQFRRAVVVTAR